MRKNKLTICTMLTVTVAIQAQMDVDYSVVSVNEEQGIDFRLITSDNDYVAMPQVKRSGSTVNWLSNRVLGISGDGTKLAYISARNNTTNIFIKEIGKLGSSVQRTNRQAVLDFSYSPDGKHISFSEGSGKLNQIFQTSATSGYACRQITNGARDYSPIYSADGKNIFFARQETKSISIWSYNLNNNSLSNYTKGMNPCPTSQQDILLCTRMNNERHGEIWRINFGTGVEECILADPVRSFTTPQLSPDGQWILMVGSSVQTYGTMKYANTDIFVCRTDGTRLQQLTYHAADDLSPVWSKDGKYIYFISQRGSAQGTANVWQMPFVIL